MTPTLILAALTSGAAVYFFVQWITGRRLAATLTEIERRSIEIADSQKRERRRTLKHYVEDLARSVGWEGDLVPVGLAWALFYLFLAAAATLVGASTPVAAIAALPLSFGIIFMFFARRNAQAQARFATQLVQALELLSSQVKAGSSPAAALNEILPSLDDPIRSELARVVEQVRATRPLDEAVAEVGERYPSRAMTMFVAALSISNEKGAQITAALDRAAEMVRSQTELVSETKAELAQDKGQFYGMVAVIGFIVFYMVTGGAGEALRTPLGLMVIAVFGGNFLLGVWRALRIMSKAAEGL